jgi:thioredoxin-dependent peroxiredoxin
MLSVGQKAPDFKVQDHTGRTVTLGQFAGQTVVLWFYPKADTPGCTAEGCGFRDRQTQFAQKNAVILGVSFDTVEENKAFARKFGFEFPLLCDTSRAIGLSYGAASTKEDAHAKRIAYVIDPQGKIAKVFPKVEAASFPETVAAEL